MNRVISRYLLILGLVGMTDMLCTSVGIALGQIGENNPMMDWVLSRFGLDWFIAFKTTFVLWPVWLLGAKPWMGEADRARTGERYTVAAIVLYPVILAVGLLVQFF